MTPGKFLRLVWPDEGFYCIAHPFKPKDSDKTVYAHHVFKTISEAVTHVHEVVNLKDVFFACLTLREERVWDPAKTDWKTGELGAWTTRTQANALAAKSVFWDLDVGPAANKYDSQADALKAIRDFVDVTGLPMPTINSSGGGLHIFWHLDTAVPAAEWRNDAQHVKQLGETLGMRVDGTRTIDSASVLRVPDTFNLKDPNNRRPVVTIQEGPVTPLEVFRKVLSDAMIAHGAKVEDAPLKPTYVAPAIDNPLGEQRFNDFGPDPTFAEVGAACGQLREMTRSMVDPTHAYYHQMDNDGWYRGFVGTVIHTEDGADWCRKLTAMDPRTNANVEAKIRQQQQYGPARCDSIPKLLPWKDAPCLKCQFYQKVPNPLTAARKSTLAPPPMANPAPTVPSPPPLPAGSSSAVPPPVNSSVPTAPSVALLAALIPQPPLPYKRLKTGGIAVTKTDKDGDETTTTIYGCDLYPIKRLVNDEGKNEQQVWRVTLPRSGAREFTIDSSVLYDGRSFPSAMANNGIFPHKADIPALQDYMIAYIAQLQREADADNQLSHLGWTDGYRQFVLPDKTLHHDGRVTQSALTEAAKRATQFIGKRGTLQQQISNFGFYNRPEYYANQFAILCSLGSVLFHMTGNHGIVVNMSGESGASKSTTLYTGAGVWGDPALWPINGTNRGATANARSARIATNANLPTPVDEITHLPAKEAIDLVMNITQPGHRLRLSTDGSEKAGADNYKAAIMISTANSSLHSLLATDAAAGTAGSMRVFEMRFVAQNVHTKAEADEFLRSIKENYGHIGEIFARYVVQNHAAIEKAVHAAMRKIDATGRIQASERFWSAVIAVAMVAGDIAKALGLMPYDTDALLPWALEVQVPFMRGVVKDEYRDPTAILTDYIAEKSGSIAVVSRGTATGTNTGGASVAPGAAYVVNPIHGALLGHYDEAGGVMYLLKQGFKDHCNRVGGSASRVIEELHQPMTMPDLSQRRLIVEKQVRRVLGAGTSLAKGQSWCFAVDMTHPRIAGEGPKLVATATVAAAAVAPIVVGNLRVVK